MEYTQGYGSLVIRFDNKGKAYLTPEKGKDMINEVFPDAAEFVTLYCKDTMLLKTNKGLSIFISPSTSAKSLIAEYRLRHDSSAKAKDDSGFGAQMMA